MHTSVLLNESINNLNLNNGSIIVDCTLGYGGHSSEILKKINNGYLYCFDQDEDAIKYSSERLNKIGNNYTIINSNFVNIKEELNKLGISEVDGILYDLGVSSPQLDEESRGFSFHKDSKLDMRMDKNNILSAFEVVNNYSQDKLIDVLRKYGEEKYAVSIVKGIIKNRPINTTLELVEVIKNNVPEKYKREKHPARKTFQAIRIEVNHELDILEEAMRKALSLLKVNGRMVVITFHSLEDRIVKDVFREVTSIPNVVKGLPNIPNEYLPDYKLINNKPIVANEKELIENNRSRSAKLRIIERIK